jgi:transcriptional regulator with XRE-family HTH domain
MQKEILKRFGSKVKEFRLNQNLSQEELAHKANLHRTYIGMIERGEKNITLLNIEKIAKALVINMHELFQNIGE